MEATEARVASHVRVMRLCFSEGEWDHLMTFEHMRYAFEMAQTPEEVDGFIERAEIILRRDGRKEFSNREFPR
jgi:hypothetical protein